MQGSLASARIFISFLFEIWIPKSVVDFGCGRGTWLAVCKERGAQRVVGLDGDWVSQEMMVDPTIDFRPTNLREEVLLGENYELALSLEVAEHLPPETSEKFIRSLTRSSDAVLFSAAFLGQPGTNHVNTRAHSFWANMFFNQGYLLFDIFRPLFWSDNRVEPWYRQNTFLYVKNHHPLYRALIEKGHDVRRDARFVDCIHPWLYFGLLNQLANSGKPPAAPVSTAPPARRNDPCPCGSGKKYKHCHGRA